MNRTDRLYAIAEALRSAGRAGKTAAWLARRFEVSTRTIKRDIAALQVAGTGVVGQDGRGGGYQLASSAPLPVEFTGGEAAAIAIALGASPELPFAVDGRAALAKVMRAMNATQRSEVTRLAGRVWVREGDPRGSRGSTGCARLLDEALRRGVVVAIDYEDNAGRQTLRRRVEPLAFARTGGCWYVLAWCQTRGGGRWFRFDRIQKVRLTREPTEHRSLRDVFGDPPADAQPIELRLR